MRFNNRTPNPVLPQHSRHSGLSLRRKERSDRPQHEKGYLSQVARGHFVAMSSEFVGTFLFLWFAFSGTQIANTIQPSSGPDTGQLFYIALSFGFSLTVNAWVFYRISGGLFNPAVGLYLKKASEVPASMLMSTVIGDPWSLPWRWSPLDPRRPPLHPSTPRCDRSRSPRVRYVPWPHVCEHNLEPWHHDRPRSLHRDVSDFLARHHGATPRGRKVQGNIYRTGRHWTIIVCGRALWYVKNHLLVHQNYEVVSRLTRNCS